MPLPESTSGESQKDFVSRCMGSEKMNSEYPDEKQRYAVCMKQYEMETQEQKVYDIDNVEIFEAGTWNGDTYSESDLDEIVKSFTEIGSIMKPYLKLGHDANQVLLQKSGMPAAGWITGVKREGTKLLATLKNIPEKIYNLISKKAYGRISSEIYWNMKHGDKVYPRVLKAAALLGGDTPALGSLDDFISLYEREFEGELHSYYEDNMADNDAKVKELELSLKEFELKHAESEKNYQAEISTLKADLEKVTGEKDAIILAAKEAEVKSYIKSAMDSGKVTPAQEAHFTKLAMGDFESVKSIIDNAAPVVPLGTSSHAAGTSESTHSNENNHNDVDHNKVMEYMKSNNVDYRVAYLEVSKGGK